jgi:hypothetical protein
MALRTANRLVHSAEVWLKRRRRARHDRRRCQSYIKNNYCDYPPGEFEKLTPRTSVRSVGSDVTRRSRAILANARQLLDI